MNVTIMFPRIPLKKRHDIEDELERAGFNVDGGGTDLRTGVQDITLRIPESKLGTVRRIIKRFGYGFEIE